jgi:hypothetical protein
LPITKNKRKKEKGMSKKYTPTLEQVRDAFAEGYYILVGGDDNPVKGFDRWLKKRDATARDKVSNAIDELLASSAGWYMVSESYRHDVRVIYEELKLRCSHLENALKDKEYGSKEWRGNYAALVENRKQVVLFEKTFSELKGEK